MKDIRKDYDEAEKLYRRAVKLDPNHADYTGNFGEFLIARRRVPEAWQYLARAWELNGGEVRDSAAEICFNWWLGRRLMAEDDSAGLGRLKTLLEAGFLRQPWTFDDVLETAAKELSDEEMAFYRALAAAILDETKVDELEGFERWAQQTPIPIDEPWDMEG